MKVANNCWLPSVTHTTTWPEWLQHRSQKIISASSAGRPCATSRACVLVTLTLPGSSRGCWRLFIGTVTVTRYCRRAVICMQRCLRLQLWLLQAEAFLWHSTALHPALE